MHKEYLNRQRPVGIQEFCYCSACGIDKEIVLINTKNMPRSDWSTLNRRLLKLRHQQNGHRRKRPYGKPW